MTPRGSTLHSYAPPLPPVIALAGSTNANAKKASTVFIFSPLLLLCNFEFTLNEVSSRHVSICGFRPAFESAYFFATTPSPHLEAGRLPSSPCALRSSLISPCAHQAASATTHALRIQCATARNSCTPGSHRQAPHFGACRTAGNH